MLTVTATVCAVLDPAGSDRCVCVLCVHVLTCASFHMSPMQRIGRVLHALSAEAAGYCRGSLASSAPAHHASKQ